MLTIMEISAVHVIQVTLARLVILTSHVVRVPVKMEQLVLMVLILTPVTVLLDGLDHNAQKVSKDMVLTILKT